jgi:hypothetical protein
MDKVYLILLVAMIAGCSSSQTSANSSTATFGDCMVDLRQICESFVRQPTFTLNGAQTNARQLEQNGAPHTQIWIPFNYPNGDLIANLECMIDTQKMTASYARLLPGPPITDKEVQYARSLGLCSDQGGVEPTTKPDLEKIPSAGGS